MSLSNADGTRPSLSLAPLPGFEPAQALFPVDHGLVVADPPTLQEGLRAAALLWCTHSAWPTVRAIAACAGIGASTVLWPYGSSDAMRHALVRAERSALATLIDEHGGDLATAVAERVDLLAAHDARLSRLPLMVALAAGVHDADELAALAREVRQLPAA
jgi:hypothetical protein